MKQVHKYVLRRLFRDEYERFIERYGKNPLVGIKRILAANKMDYVVSGSSEVILRIGEKKVVIRQED